MASLIHRWKLTENANDSVGTLNLTNNGGVTFGADGAILDGAGKYLSATLAQPVAMSVCGWIKVTTFQRNGGLFGWSDDDPNFTLPLADTVPSNSVTWWDSPNISRYTRAYNVWNTTYFPANTHVFVAMTRAANTVVKGYIGDDLYATAAAGTIGTSTLFCVGNKNTGYSNGQNEKDIRIYNGELTAEEIAVIVAAGPNPSTGPLRLMQVI